MGLDFTGNHDTPGDHPPALFCFPNPLVRKARFMTDSPPLVRLLHPTRDWVTGEALGVLLLLADPESLDRQPQQHARIQQAKDLFNRWAAKALDELDRDINGDGLKDLVRRIHLQLAAWIGDQLGEQLPRG